MKYPLGLRLIEAGKCPIGAVNPIACWTCQFGHATECHHPLDCEQAKCGHWLLRASLDAALLVLAEHRRG